MLLVLVALGVLVETAQPIHVHASDTPGIYRNVPACGLGRLPLERTTPIGASFDERESHRGRASARASD